MKLNTGLRIAIVVCVLALALTAAYYYGTARAASVVALPAEITLGNSSATAATTSTTTAAPTTTTSSTPTTPASNAPAVTNSTTGTTGSTPATGTTKSSTKSSSTPTTTVQRHVVTTVWDWNCDNGNWGSGRGGW